MKQEHLKHVAVSEMRTFIAMNRSSCKRLQSGESPVVLTAEFLEATGFCPRQDGLTDRAYVDIWRSTLLKLIGKTPPE